MFSGIIRGKGKVVTLESSGGLLAISSSALTDCVLGDSVSVSGTCLTVSKIEGESFFFEVSAETLRRTKLGDLKVGSEVNLEHPLKLSDLLHGHLVQGHVDGVGRLASITPESDSHRLEFHAGKDVLKYLVSKGSITIDGVSLTVGEVTADGFSVYIIPTTWEWTTLSGLKPGDSVNLECDIIAKYVERLLMFNSNEVTS